MMYARGDDHMSGYAETMVKLEMYESYSMMYGWFEKNDTILLQIMTEIGFKVGWCPKTVKYWIKNGRRLVSSLCSISSTV